MFIKWPLLILFIFCTSVASEIGLKKNLFKIDKIEIVGSKRVEPEAILEKMLVKKGSLLSNYSLRDDIETIYQMRYFESVEAHQLTKGGKNILQIRVKEKPIISKIYFEGNDELSNDDLKEQIKTKEFSILDINTIKSDLLAIQKFYESKGYYLASADYDLKSVNDGAGMHLILKVKEYDQVHVKKISFIGNKQLVDGEIKKFMQTREEGLFSFMSGSGNFKEFDFQTDIERIKYLYKSKGYLQINVGSPMVTVSEDKKWIFITIKINEGPKFSINSVSYEGDLLFSEEELSENTKLKAEETYSEEVLRQDILKLTEMYQDKGYAFANVLRNLSIVPGENKVNIQFSFEKGRIAYFGKIFVKGNTKTRDKVVRRELNIEEGMKYSGSKLRRSKENVNRLGFFEPGSVVFNTIASPDRDDVLDVEISIKERQTGQITLGAGYSTATKTFIQASIAQNNFRGLGQTLNFNFSWANRQQIYNIGFTEPYLFDTKWTAGADVYRSINRLIRSFNSKKEGGDIRVGYPVFDYTRLFFTLKGEKVTISENINPTIDPDLENGTTLSLKSSLVYDRRNNIFEPTNGYYGNASVEHAGLAGDQKWFKASLEGRLYKPIWKDIIFKTRMRAQQIWDTSDRPVPRLERFTLGGARNLRGYNIEDVGPRQFYTQNADGDTLNEYLNNGGQFSLLSSFELEAPLVKDAGIKWVLFFDAGNVYETSFDNDESDIKANYGFGFRWFSPIGILRFEFGYPLNKIKGEEKRDKQFHFDIGPYF